MHSALDFGLQYPDEYREWHNSLNTIVTLAVKTEKDLWDLCSKLDSKKEIKYTKFFEPDIGYSLTSIVIVPNHSSDIKKICSGISLAGKVLPNAEQIQTNQNDLMDLCFDNKENLEHKFHVRNRLFDLLRFIKDQTHVFQYEWKLPNWFFLMNMNILKENLCSEYEASKYTMFHDLPEAKKEILPSGKKEILELLYNLALLSTPNQP
jgi:hypothetical protein